VITISVGLDVDSAPNCDDDDDDDDDDDE